jgi:hypothetical protein
VIHLYAFVDGLHNLPGIRGAAGEPLIARPLPGLTAVVGEPDSPLATTTETAIAHGAVVEALREHAEAVLPVRLAGPFADAAAFHAAVQPQLPALRERLMRLRGCVELGVRIATPDPEESRDGATYLRRRAAVSAARATLAEELHTAVRPYALERRVDDSTTFQGAYLVRRGDVEAFARQVDRLGGRHPEAAVICTGPWAPYSFAEGAA